MARKNAADARQLGLGVESESRVPVRSEATQRYTEGNLIEAPIWALSNKAVKPVRYARDASGSYIYEKNDKGQIVKERRTGQPKRKTLFDKADYERVLEREIVRDGRRVRERWTIRASVHHGWPSMTVFAVALVIIDKARRLKFRSQKVPITRGEILRKLGMGRGGNDYDLVNAAVCCGMATTWTAENVWVGPADEKAQAEAAAGGGAAAQQPATVAEKGRTKRVRYPSLLITSLFKGARLADEVLETKEDDGEVKKKEEPENAKQEEFLGDFVELGDAVWESAKSLYLIGIDLAYFAALKQDGAQRLYAYLAKRAGSGAPIYREGLAGIAFHFGLYSSSPSVVKAYLTPHLEAMKKELPTSRGPRRFIKDYRFVRFDNGEEGLEIYWPENRSVRPEAEDSGADPRDDDEFRKFCLDAGTPTECQRTDLGAARFELDAGACTMVVHCVDEFHLERMRDPRVHGRGLDAALRAYLGTQRVSLTFVLAGAGEEKGPAASQEREK